MKWKITLRYVLSVAIVTVIVVQLNLLLAFGVFAVINFNTVDGSNNALNFSENLIREFSEYIINDSDDINDVHISDYGKKLLEDNKLWIQILDNDGREIYRYNLSSEAKTKYTPIELISGYKYSGEITEDSTVFAASKNINNYEYSYLMGFPMRNISKYVLAYDIKSIYEFAVKAIVGMIILDAIVAIIIGYIFSKSLTKPVKNIIGGVEDLSSGNYEKYYREEGIYKPVISKLNHLSDVLKESEVERQRIEEMRSEWIANVSHDIKTPLASIKGYSQLMSEDYEITLDDIKEYSQIIDDKANYIKELVDDLNLTMKLKNKYSNIERKEKNIVAIVRGCIIDILNDPKYSHIDIEFNTDNETIILNMDELLIKRVINNLLYNAIVHNNENVNIEVNIVIDDKIHIFIEDNGKGIAKEEVGYIFERYYRGTNTGEIHKGSGLGMAIARDIIIAHDGNIKIESELGKGTKIEITLG
ncbi:sensor histidine kinase [Romboutsia weinsteinii]|uniref:histidine kinase n=1 Tax=Romboutsia weinsteinii TaxID=2020949 RepID=A0A371J124_9FIRM|nr:HAMP domain-containing sensor histidine kinase [Romboutsia weinsteinii]RDY26470.1 sensor histidine kinase [Romboutsia weinsteinii]